MMIKPREGNSRAVAPYMASGLSFYAYLIEIHPTPLKRLRNVTLLAALWDTLDAAGAGLRTGRTAVFRIYGRSIGWLAEAAVIINSREALCP